MLQVALPWYLRAVGQTYSRSWFGCVEAKARDFSLRMATSKIPHRSTAECGLSRPCTEHSIRKTNFRSQEEILFAVVVVYYRRVLHLNLPDHSVTQQWLLLFNTSTLSSAPHGAINDDHSSAVMNGQLDTDSASRSATNGAMSCTHEWITHNHSLLSNSGVVSYVPSEPFSTSAHHDAPGDLLASPLCFIARQRSVE